VILDVINQRFPDVKAAISLGYWFTTAPQYYNGVLYIGSTRSESHIPGGHVLAVDAKTGKVLWHFNTVPQDEKDQGWDIAGPTWVGGERNGGGIWETPSIDPELGLLYVAVANPFGESSKRAGINLFTDSIIALTLNSGTLKWYFQQTHHDVWDYDSGNQPVLFDMTVRGQRVKALAEASKNGFLYILNRETGQPVHSIKEMPVPTATTRPNEQPWPTQPIPYSASGKMMLISPVVPTDIPAERLAVAKPVPMFTPLGPNQIYAPGTEGGANYGPVAFSPRTGLLYINAIDSPMGSGRPPRGFFSAYDPTTGDLKWQKTFDGQGQAGSVVTASDLVFVGTGSNTAGYFFAFDAKSGEPLWKFNTGAGVFSSPSMYMVNGVQFVAVGSGGGERGRRGGDLILSFALPK
jgi:quinohemoprotein ethanol dehydrogenase